MNEKTDAKIGPSLRPPKHKLKPSKPLPHATVLSKPEDPRPLLIDPTNPKLIEDYRLRLQRFLEYQSSRKTNALFLAIRQWIRQDVQTARIHSHLMPNNWDKKALLTAIDSCKNNPDCLLWLVGCYHEHVRMKGHVPVSEVATVFHSLPLHETGAHPAAVLLFTSFPEAHALLIDQFPSLHAFRDAVSALSLSQKLDLLGFLDEGTVSEDPEGQIQTTSGQFTDIQDILRWTFEDVDEWTLRQEWTARQDREVLAIFEDLNPLFKHNAYVFRKVLRSLDKRTLLRYLDSLQGSSLKQRAYHLLGDLWPVTPILESSEDKPMSFFSILWRALDELKKQLHLDTFARHRLNYWKRKRPLVERLKQPPSEKEWRQIFSFLPILDPEEQALVHAHSKNDKTKAQFWQAAFAGKAYGVFEVLRKRALTQELPIYCQHLHTLLVTLSPSALNTFLKKLSPQAKIVIYASLGPKIQNDTALRESLYKLDAENTALLTQQLHDSEISNLLVKHSGHDPEKYVASVLASLEPTCRIRDVMHHLIEDASWKLRSETAALLSDFDKAASAFETASAALSKQNLKTTLLSQAGLKGFIGALNKKDVEKLIFSHPDPREVQRIILLLEPSVQEDITCRLMPRATQITLSYIGQLNARVLLRILQRLPKTLAVRTLRNTRDKQISEILLHATPTDRKYFIETCLPYCKFEDHLLQRIPTALIPSVIRSVLQSRENRIINDEEVSLLIKSIPLKRIPEIRKVDDAFFLPILNRMTRGQRLIALKAAPQESFATEIVQVLEGRPASYCKDFVLDLQDPKKALIAASLCKKLKESLSDKTLEKWIEKGKSQTP